jgi:LCP family protein required for cell wall assembly
VPREEAGKIAPPVRRKNASRRNRVTNTMSSDRSPALAAGLSLIFPGLGQIYAGAVRRGVLWAIPTLLLILVAILVLAGGQQAMLNLVSSDEKVMALVALNIAFFFYHVAAMFDAYGIAQRNRRSIGAGTSGTGAVALVALVVVALLIHGVPTTSALTINDFLNRFLKGRPGVIASASFTLEPIESIPPEITDSPEPTEPGSATPSPTNSGGQSATPVPTPSGPPQSFPPIGNWGDRVNLLLIGSDAGPGRHGGRTDTMILLSVEVTTGKAALFGFPRNMTNVPIEDAAGTLTFNRLWTDPFDPGNGDPQYSLITNMWQYAYNNPDKFYTPPDACAADDPNLEQCQGDARAFRATTSAIQNLAGVQINGVVAVNLEAFRELVDAVGGVWMNIPDAIYDDDYPAGDDVSPRIIDIPEGCNWFNRIYALAYARSRHQDSDYKRMKRQQMVLQAVRRQIDPISMLPRLDELLGIASNNMWTTLERGDIETLAQIASRVDADRLYQVRFVPGANYPSHLTSTEIRLIRSRVQHIFEQPQPQPSPTPSNPAQRCPAPGQTPGPSFNTSPSPKP